MVVVEVVIIYNTCVTLMQDDYSQVESMAGERQKEVESLLEELTQVRTTYASPELQVLTPSLFACVESCFLYRRKLISVQ